MISSLLHLFGLRPRVYYTLPNFRGGAKAPLAPPPQYANAVMYTIWRVLIIPSVSLLPENRRTVRGTQNCDPVIFSCVYASSW